MFRPSRKDHGPDPALNRKVWIFFLGAFLAFAGMWMEAQWLVGVAIAVLVLGMALRFIPRFRTPERAEEDDSVD
jgi:hypothetical protein